jgi:hypothetical protein
MRFLPQWVLAGTALVAIVVVGSVYLNNLPAPAVHAVESARIAAPLREVSAARVPAVEAVTAAAEQPELPPEPDALPQPPDSIPVTATVPVSGAAPLPGPEPRLVPAPAPRIAPVTKPLPTPTPVPAIARMPVPAPAATPVKPATRQLPKETPTVPIGTTALGLPASPVPAPQPLQQRVTKAVASVAPTPVAAPARELPVIQSPPPEPRVAAVAARPTGPDPDATLAQFLASYERGDTQAFMALFDEVAIGRAGGKPQIRRQHESLFRSTDLRHLDIDGMAWSQEGDWIRGEGRYRKTVMPKGELRLQTETGVFRIELLRRGEQALIMGLDYQPGGRT